MVMENAFDVEDVKVDVKEMQACFPAGYTCSTICMLCCVMCAVLHGSSLNMVCGKTGGPTLEQCQEKSSSV